jgi:hypothetical protein
MPRARIRSDWRTRAPHTTVTSLWRVAADSVAIETSHETTPTHKSDSIRGRHRPPALDETRSSARVPSSAPASQWVCVSQLFAIQDARKLSRLSHKAVRKPVRQLVVGQQCSEPARSPSSLGQCRRTGRDRASSCHRCPCNLISPNCATASVQGGRLSHSPGDAHSWRKAAARLLTHPRVLARPR